MTNDKDTSIGTRTNPLRLSKTPEELDAARMDESRDDIGVSGSAYSGEEATIVLSVSTPGWHHMDVEYAKTVVIMLADAIKGAKKHNEALAKAAKVQ